ncbi:glycosyltransferase [Panacibacter ginsenosidivorans]|uniref:Glycosyltransferase n=1 Tax=Panacibacter ginsenosidivorans TaxID=1813871 RepID=A0A5B8VCA4_9BACT|nr:glycosyltransferase [Panacibacter ginsenosidivorans]QEC69074.1 glycosyltransferase [Panacibacter ginsenosidivorans]
MHHPLISVITPCYNQGQYVEDAIQSIPYEKVNFDIEHIIIDDGSTDSFSLQKFKELEESGTNIIHQENKGLATTRNIGISMAKGKYIIPLDADNKLNDVYFTKAIDILEQHDNIDVVYGDFTVFGTGQRTHETGDFDICNMIEWNKIDACAIFRKSAFDRVDGYDTNMVFGCEDWDLWLNLYFNGSNFYYLPEVAFYYRVTSQSMLQNITEPNKQVIRQYLYKKYHQQIIEVLLKRKNDAEAYSRQLLKYKNAEKQTIKATLKLLLKGSII